MARILRCARIGMFGVTLALAFAVICQSASAQQFITVSYPGATATYSEGINNRGEIVGTYSDAVANATVPEPGTLVLIASGLAGVILLRRRPIDGVTQ